MAKTSNTRITRKQAATILGVTPTSISNYLKNGILTGEVSHGHLFFDEEEVKKYARSFKTIHFNEMRLVEQLSQLQESNIKANKRLGDIKQFFVMDGKGQSLKNIIRFIDVINCNPAVKVNLSKQEQKLLSTYLLNGMLGVSPLSKRYNITMEKCRQMIIKALYKIPYMCEQMRFVLSENVTLRSQVSALTVRNEELEVIVKEYETIHKEEALIKNIRIPDILDKNISSFNLSTRTKRALESCKIITVRDLLIGISDCKDLLKIRNFGKRCLTEVSAFVENNGLCFKQQNESMGHFFVRLCSTRESIESHSPSPI